MYFTSLLVNLLPLKVAYQNVTTMSSDTRQFELHKYKLSININHSMGSVVHFHIYFL